MDFTNSPCTTVSVVGELGSTPCNFMGGGGRRVEGETKDCKHYHDRTHASDAFKLLNSYRLSAFLCDVEIKVGERVFPCHRAVLAATIPYFHSMFSSDMIESRERQITIQDISPDAFEQIMSFCYTSNLEFSTSSVQPLLFAASILQMDSVCSACEEFLTQYLTVQNCLAIRNFAQQHNCVQLMDSIDSFSADNFPKLRQHSEFVQITFSHMLDLIQRSDLHVSSESDVYETVMAWVQADLEHRKQFLPRLLIKIRLAQLNTAFLLEKVKSHALIKDDGACKELVFEALHEQLAERSDIGAVAGCQRLGSTGVSVKNPAHPMTRGSEVVTKCRDRTRPRKSAAGVVFCVGGRGTSGDPFRTVEAFDWRKDRWFPVTEMGVKRRHVGVVSADGKLYAIGGHDGTEHLESAEYFDPVYNLWKPVASMGTRRRGIAVGYLEGAIYAVGGLDDSTCFQTVERYDIEADRWSSVAMMNVQRGGVGVAALGKFLFAVGGNDGTASLDSCERYDPHLDKWTLVAQMAHRRAGAGVTVLNGALYAIGGFDDNSPLSSCERYDPVSNEWTMLPQMSCPRGGVGVAAMGGRIYAVGGHDGLKYLDSVEAFDPDKNTWEPVSSISHCRAGAGVAWCQCSVDTLQPVCSFASPGGVASCV